VEVLPQIHDFVLELDHSLLVELLVLRSHLLLHQKKGVDGLILLVVLLYLVGQDSRFVDQLVNGFFIAAQMVVLNERLLVECEVLLEI
jgi:hypothetical protein